MTTAEEVRKNICGAPFKFVLNIFDETPPPPPPRSQFNRSHHLHNRRRRHHHRHNRHHHRHNRRRRHRHHSHHRHHHGRRRLRCHRHRHHRVRSQIAISILVHRFQITFPYFDFIIYTVGPRALPRSGYEHPGYKVQAS